MNKKEYTITILQGDGIGPEVVNESIKVLKSLSIKYGYQFKLLYEYIGAISIEKFGIPLTNKAIETASKSDAILLGSVGDDKYNCNNKVKPEDGLLQLRKAMKVYCNIRPVKIYNKLIDKSFIKSEFIQNVDFIIYRELTGGIYFGNKKYDNNEAYDECIYTSDEIKRITCLAFEHAKKRKKHLTLVDKANVLATSKLWRKIVSQYSKLYHDVSVNYMLVDNAAMQIISNPSQFDIILTDNMFGDILSDEASTIVGSLGLLPSSSIGSKTPIYEPIHGSFPQAKGKNIANPIGSILSLSMMLKYLQLEYASNLILTAVNKAIDCNIVTKDINNNNFCTTSEFGDFICNYINNI